MVQPRFRRERKGFAPELGTERASRRRTGRRHRGYEKRALAFNPSGLIRKLSHLLATFGPGSPLDIALDSGTALSAHRAGSAVHAQCASCAVSEATLCGSPRDRAVLGIVDSLPWGLPRQARNCRWPRCRTRLLRSFPSRGFSRLLEVETL